MTGSPATRFELIPSEPVTVCEVWSRDGLQGWPAVIPTADKVAVVSAAIDAGIREVDVTSFVSPKITPQFGDAVEVLRALRSRHDQAVFRVLVVNTRSLDTMTANPDVLDLVDVAGFPISADEQHNIANVGRTHAEHQERLAAVVEGCQELGVAPLLCVATAFGSPLGGAVPVDKALELARWGVDRGVRKLMFGDTTGMADPVHVAALFSAARREFPGISLYAHFHDTRGVGLANTLAAIGSGVRTVDSCLGGAGGEPPTVEQNHSGEMGNVVTEDLVAVLDRMGFHLGIDVPALLAVGRRVEELSGRAMRSQVLRSGLAPAA